jgi:LmbE family N-acetylglucosaminyl deacetylase
MNPGAVVATVCSGKPEPGSPASKWDARFGTADRAIDERRKEDREALVVLGATQHILGFCDHPYRSDAEPFEDDLERSIGQLVDELRPTSCFVPLGFGHVDHRITGRAARRALASRPWCEAVVYVDLPYKWMRRFRSELKGQRVRLALERRVESSPSSAVPKREALACYPSQRALMSGTLWRRTERLDAEEFWRLRPQESVRGPTT